MSDSSEYEFVFTPTKMQTSFSRIQTMRQHGDLCDVSFDVKGKKILAHRVILAANIPYFGDMFLREPSQVKREIVFETMEPFAFESLIEFAYTNEIKINTHNVRSLLIGATLLQMDEVCNACITFISKTLHPGNALEILNFASSVHFVALKAAAEEYVLKHFVEISHSEDFLDMSFSDLKELISKDELHVMNEEEVFQAVIAWVKKSPSAREKGLPHLLAVIRMPLLSYHYLSTVVASEELIKKSVYCVNLVNEAKTHWTNGVPLRRNLTVGHRNFSVDSYITKNNSISYKKKNYLYALFRLKGRKAYPTIVACYNLMTAEWKIMKSRTTFVKDAAIAVMSKKLYVIGGCNGIGRLLDAVQVFDTESDSWSFTESFPTKISQAAVAVCAGKIYVFGGKTDDDESTKYVYCYSPETTWKYVDKMYQARRAACAVTLNDCVYILGGYDGKKTLNSVEMYNPVKGEWKKISSLGTEAGCYKATSNTNRIYIYGGQYVQFYDDCLKEWDKICDMRKQNIECMSILAFEGKLYIIGGKLGADEKHVYIYDLDTDKWMCGKALPPNMTFISAIAITENC